MSQCTIINAHITDQVLQLSNLPRIASGLVGALQIRCNFCGKWDGCGKIGVFYRDKSDVYHVPLENGLVTVPWEVLQDEGYFWFGIMGQDDLTRTTEAIRIEVAKGALTVATATPQDPTPDIYQQLVAAQGVLEARFNAAVAVLDTGDPASTLDVTSADGLVRVKISANGFAAMANFYVEAGVGDYLAAGNSAYRTDYIIPAEYAPLSQVTVRDHLYPDLLLTLSTDPTTGKARVSITGAPLSYFAESATYGLAKPSLTELPDIRVGYDGSTYGTAGEAVRVQVGEINEQLDGINHALMDLGEKGAEIIGEIADARRGINSKGSTTDHGSLGQAIREQVWELHNRCSATEGEVDDLNDAVFDVEVIPPSINVYNPNTATYVPWNETNGVWRSETIPCVVGDKVRVRVKTPSGEVGTPGGVTAFWLVGANGEVVHMGNNLWHDQTIKADSNISEIVGIQVGVRRQTLLDGIGEDNPVNIMVTVNYTPASGSEFIPYKAEEIIKHNKIEQLQGQVDGLTEQTTELSAEVDAVKESLAKVGDLADDVGALNTAVFGYMPDEPVEPVNPYLIDGGIELFTENGIYSGLAIYNQAGRPRSGPIEITGEPITVRVYSFKDNGMTSAQGAALTSIGPMILDADKKPIAGLGGLKLYGIRADGTVYDGQGFHYGYPSEYGLSYIEKAQSGTGDYMEPYYIGGGIATITAEQLAGAKYIDFTGLRAGQEISLKIWQGEDPAADDGDDVEGSGLIYDVERLKEKVVELEESINTEPEKVYDITEGNEALIATAFGDAAGAASTKYATDFAAIALTDMHSKFVSIDDAAAVRDCGFISYKTPEVVILNAGDSLYVKPKADGVVQEAEIKAYVDKAVEHCVYHTLGNHDVGGTYNKAECLTHDEAFDRYIKPMREVWGLPNLDTIYYYKDFPNTRTEKGTRLISLYQYNVPLITDPTDSTKYKYARNKTCFGQEQLNWLVDTLSSVPDGYRVIIMMHENEGAVVPIESVFNCDFGTIGGTYLYLNNPITEIVGAYVGKTTLSKTYTPYQPDKFSPDDFTVTVNANFTNAKGEFAHYLTGHIHYDLVGYVNGTQQRHIILTSNCEQSSDCYIKPNANNATRSLVSLLGYDYNHNAVRLGRVGQQYAMSGQNRSMERVSLSGKE